MSKKIFILLCAAVVALCAMANLKRLPVRVKEGKKYYVYQVQPGEGELAIAKKLGVAVSEIRRQNPGVQSGLKAYQELFFAVEANNDAVAEKQYRPLSYTAKKGDTLYGICRKFGLTEDAFLSMNPQAAYGIKADNVYVVGKQEVKTDKFETAGQTSATTEAAEKVGKAFQRQETKYTVQAHDTFYGVARHHGLSIAQLQAANPGVNVLKEGMEIVIPDGCDVADAVVAPTAVNEQEEEVATPGVPAIESRRGPVLSVVLPFHMNAKPQPKHSRNYADFMRGFVLAVDSFKSDANPVQVLAFDSEGSADKVKSLLGDSLLKRSDVIVTTGISDNEEALYEYGRANNIGVFNIFSVKDSTWKENRNAIQCNTPTDVMVDLAVDYMKRNFSGYVPVIVRIDGFTDKLATATAVAKAIDPYGVNTLTVRTGEKVTAKDFAKLKGNKQYLFIPSTSKVQESKQLLEVLGEEYENLQPEANAVFGYPEWVTMRDKKTVALMKDLNTYIYSRFSEADGDEREATEQSHKHWYGKGLSQGAPSMTLTGFDVARYLLSAYKDGKRDGASNVLNVSQTGMLYPFKFKQPDGTGAVNSAAYMIHYSPAGEIENILIE